MTPDRLRALVEAARLDERVRIVLDGMSPDLALLLADAMGVLAVQAKATPAKHDPPCSLGSCAPHALLARFRALGG